MKFSPLFLASLAVALAACSSGTDTGMTDDTVTNLPFDVVDTLPAGTFTSSGEAGFNGDLTVRGYAEIVEVDEPFCVDDCETFDYVVFHVQETGNASLGDFLGQNEGNAYAGGDSIGLGCDEEGSIRYINHSDAQDMQETVLTGDTARMILASTEVQPVTLHLDKLPLTGGTEAPACYSHFTTIELADI